jgi:uncharacterized protein YndB with AHSA1/START domain
MNRVLFAAVALLSLAPGGAAAASPDQGVVETVVVVDAPVEKAWWAFTTKEGLEAWMVGLASVELKVGGPVLTRYKKDGKLGDAGTIAHTLAAYDPLRMVVWKPARAPAGFPFEKAWLKTWSVIYFEPLPGGRTRVTSRMLGYDDSADSQKMRRYFVGGNQQTFVALQRFLRQR